MCSWGFQLIRIHPEIVITFPNALSKQLRNWNVCGCVFNKLGHLSDQLVANCSKAPATGSHQVYRLKSIYINLSVIPVVQVTTTNFNGKSTLSPLAQNLVRHTAAPDITSAGWAIPFPTKHRASQLKTKTFVFLQYRLV